MNYKSILSIMVIFGFIFLMSAPVISDELDDLLGGGSTVSGGVAKDTEKPVAESGDYLVSDNLVKYFNDDPAEDGGISNPFESLIKAPEPPANAPAIRRGKEAPKPLRLKLNGVVINADIKIALIEDLDKGQSYEMAEGDKNSDFSVVEISEDKIIIFSYRLNMRRTISIND